MSKIKEIPENCTIEIDGEEVIVPTISIVKHEYTPGELYICKDGDGEYFYVLILDVKDKYFTVLFLDYAELLEIMLFASNDDCIAKKYNFITQCLTMYYRDEKLLNNLKYTATLSEGIMLRLYTKISYEYDHTNKITISELVKEIAKNTGIEINIDKFVPYDKGINISDWLIDPYESCTIEGTSRRKIL